MWYHVILRSFFILIIISSITVNLQKTNEISNRVPSKRTTPKPGFIKTVFQVAYEVLSFLRRVFSVMFQIMNYVKGPVEMVYEGLNFSNNFLEIFDEQWADTRNTFSRINQMLNDNFLPEGASATTIMPITESSDPNVTTTRAPYRITRNEFSRILRRNVKGLVRLFNLELDDALKESRGTDREFRKNASREFSKFL